MKHVLKDTNSFNIIRMLFMRQQNLIKIQNTYFALNHVFFTDETELEENER